MVSGLALLPLSYRPRGTDGIRTRDLSNINGSIRCLRTALTMV